jgi:hypothetical protein
MSITNPTYDNLNPTYDNLAQAANALAGYPPRVRR